MKRSTRIEGDRIRQARRASGLSLETVAARVGVSKAALSRWETGERHPAPDAADRLMEVLGLQDSVGVTRPNTERPSDYGEWADWLTRCVDARSCMCLDLEFLALDAVLRGKEPRSASGPDLLSRLRCSLILWLGWWYRDREAAAWASFELRDRPVVWSDPGVGRLIRAQANYLVEYGRGSVAAAKLLGRAASALTGQAAHGFVLREFAGNLSSCGYHAEAMAVLGNARRGGTGDESEATHQICCDLVEAAIWLDMGRPDRAFRSLPSQYPDDDMLRLSGVSTAARCLARLGAKRQATEKLSGEISTLRMKGLDHFANTLTKELLALRN